MKKILFFGLLLLELGTTTINNCSDIMTPRQAAEALFEGEEVSGGVLFALLHDRTNSVSMSFFDGRNYIVTKFATKLGPHIFIEAQNEAALEFDYKAIQKQEELRQAHVARARIRGAVAAQFALQLAPQLAPAQQPQAIVLSDSE